MMILRIIDNGDIVNDSTGVANDSTDVDVVTSSFMTLGQDTILLGLGALEYYGIEDEGKIPFLGYTNINGERCFELPYNTDIYATGRYLYSRTAECFYGGRKSRRV